MTNIDIEVLRALAEKATPGPWSMRRARERGHDFENIPVTGHMAGRLGGPTYVPHYEDSILARHDARFIAALDPTTVLTLLTELDAARKEAALLGSAMDKMRVMHSETCRRLDDELSAARAELAKRSEDYWDLSATHEAMCAELEALRAAPRKSNR